MDDKERVQSFSDMVAGAEKLTKPWRIALLATNLMWAIVTFCLIWFAYMAPVDTDFSQNQDFSNQVQSQDYSSTVTNGE